MGFSAGKSACSNTLWVKVGHERSDRADGPAYCTDGNTATVTASDEKISCEIMCLQKWAKSFKTWFGKTAHKLSNFFFYFTNTLSLALW